MESIDKEIYKLVRESKLVNGKWYLESYPDVAALGMDPIKHYLKYGWRMHRNPCRRFDTSFYLENYKGKMAGYSNPLLHYIIYGKKLGFSIKPSEHATKNLTTTLSHNLWGGYSNLALAELEKIYNSKTAKINERWWAGWHAGRWYYFIGDYKKAYEIANLLFEIPSKHINRRECHYLKSFCEMRFGDWDEARKTLKKYLALNPNDSDVYLSLSNTYLEDTRKKIACINKAFEINELIGIRVKDKRKELDIGNITGERNLKKIDGSVKVSIIMPIFNAEDRVRIAIDSLLEQTYKNIEIIAVDDCSTDSTMEVLKEISLQDSRVVPVQPPSNGGAYAARNFGLKFTTGNLLTTHDSDDWSHPQKIENQVSYMNDHSDVMGCAVHWVRVRENLEFTQNWRPNNSITHWSQSSFMFRREVLDTIGEWDHVRIGGDTEYIWRVQAHYGKASFAKILPDIPLAFALDEESSLTRTKATHVKTVYFGLRHIYREICNWWHSTNNDLRVENAKYERAFPAPRSMFEKTDQPLHYYILIAGDFSRLEDCKKVERKIQQLDKKMQSAGLLHWPDFNKKPEPLCNLYFESLEQGVVEPVVLGQVVECKKYFITESDLLNYPLDDYPEMLGLDKWGQL
nr:glycosyltransferase [uncultured Halomonas sp.]